MIKKIKLEHVIIFGLVISLAITLGKDKYNTREVLDDDIGNGTLYCKIGDEWKSIERERIKFKHASNGKYIIKGASPEICEVR